MGDLPPNPTHHPLPPNPTIGDTADRRSPARQMDPPGNERAGDPREEFPRGFTRGGFAPIPHRHADAPAASSEPERHRSPPPPPRVYDREFDRERDLPRRQEGRDREFPRRDLDPEPERDGRSWNTYYDRGARGGPPPPQWDDDYGKLFPPHREQIADTQTDQNVVDHHHRTTKRLEHGSDLPHHPDTLPLYLPVSPIQQRSTTFSAFVNSRNGSVHHIRRLQRPMMKRLVESGRSWRAVLEEILERRRLGWQSVMIDIGRSILPAKSVLRIFPAIQS
jgi:hypothetical protein